MKDGNIFCFTKKDGFTLIELIIVLFLLGIVSGLVGLYIGGDTGALELKKFTKEVSAVMRHARNKAVSEKKIYCFVIDREERMLRLYSEDTDYTNVELVMEKDIPEDLDITMKDSRSDALFVEFFPWGNSTGGTVEIWNIKGSRFFINVNRISGKLIVEKEE